MHVFVLESVLDFYNFRVNHVQFYVDGNTAKLGLMFLLKDTTQWRRWGSNPRPFGIESSTLPLSSLKKYMTILIVVLGIPNWQIEFECIYIKF